MSFWNGTPTWIRWSLIVSVLGFLILLSNAKAAIDNLHDWTPVTWGGLEAWAAPIITARNDLIAQMDAKHSAAIDSLGVQIYKSLNDIEWDQAIYRTKDLDFQIGLLEGQEFMVLLLLESDPGDQLKQQRLREVRADLDARRKELAVLVCQIEARDAEAVCP